MNNYKSELATTAWAIRKGLAASTNTPIKEVSLKHCYELAREQLSEALAVSEVIEAMPVSEVSEAMPASEVIPAIEVSEVLAVSEACEPILAIEILYRYKLPFPKVASLSFSKEFSHAIFDELNHDETVIIFYIVANAQGQNLVNIWQSSDNFMARLLIYAQYYCQSYECNSIDYNALDIGSRMFFITLAAHDTINTLNANGKTDIGQSILKPQNAPANQSERDFYTALLVNLPMHCIDELCELLPAFNSRVALYLVDYASALAKDSYIKSISVLRC